MTPSHQSNVPPKTIALNSDDIFSKEGSIAGASYLKLTRIHDVADPTFLPKGEVLEVPAQTSYTVQDAQSWIEVHFHMNGKMTGPLVFANKGKAKSTEEIYKQEGLSFTGQDPALTTGLMMFLFAGITLGVTFFLSEGILSFFLIAVPSILILPYLWFKTKLVKRKTGENAARHIKKRFGRELYWVKMNKETAQKIQEGYAK